jgi:hypothetical protein
MGGCSLSIPCEFTGVKFVKPLILAMQPGNTSSIPTIRADYFRCTSKMLRISPHLLSTLRLYPRYLNAVNLVIKLADSVQLRWR